MVGASAGQPPDLYGYRRYAARGRRSGRAGLPAAADHTCRPSAAGNASDAVARILADKMAGPLGQRLVIENKVGAGGNIGTAAVAKAAPDGYTIGLPGVRAACGQ